MAEALCLKWTDFHSSIVTALESLKCSEDLVDVTLTCEGQNMKAHRVILSACSPYFRGVFKENPCQHPIIILKDVLAGDMARLLEYMYQGEVTVQEQQLPALLQTAQLLQVSGLTAYTLTSQNKGNQQRTLVSSPSHPKRAASQTVNLKKPTATSTSQQKDQVANLKPAVNQNKKRRNSTTEKLAECLLSDSVKKTRKEKLFPNSSKMSESTSTSAEIAMTDNTEKDQSSGVNKEESVPLSKLVTFELPVAQPDDAEFLASVKVKHEVLEDEERGMDPVIQEAEGSSSPNSKPFYETSMLARSLLSGTQSLKSDATFPASTPPKVKLVQTTGEILPADIKGELLSPGGDSLEPEILIAEDDGRGAGGPPANHAAICGDCPHCGTQYSNQSALKYHVRLMHSDLTNRLCCYLCPRSFTVRDTFKEHMWSFHGQRN